MMRAAFGVGVTPAPDTLSPSVSCLVTLSAIVNLLD